MIASITSTITLENYIYWDALWFFLFLSSFFGFRLGLFVIATTVQGKRLHQKLLFDAAAANTF
jgi:hypothetical protein